MMRRPPKAPLFPSTTLFRSRTDHVAATAPTARNAAPVPRRVEESRSLPSPWAAAAMTTHRHRAGALDRESTRLNSSHAKISYAVFCLKKKKVFTSLRLLGLL